MRLFNCTESPVSCKTTLRGGSILAVNRRAGPEAVQTLVQVCTHVKLHAARKRQALLSRVSEKPREGHPGDLTSSCDGSRAHVWRRLEVQEAGTTCTAVWEESSATDPTHFVCLEVNTPSFPACVHKSVLYIGVSNPCPGNRLICTVLQGCSQLRE